MTPAAFKSALAATRLSLDGRATYGALLELVDGKNRADAAREAGCSHQAVARAVAKIRRAVGRCPECGARVRR